MARRRIKTVLYQLIALATVAAATGGFFLWCQARANNFHAIVVGEAYRSAQPTAADIRAYRAELGIKAIVNLRDGGVDAEWRSEEARTAGELGIQYVEFPMSARIKLPEARARALVEILRDAEKPVLIHCKAGSDRTGLASALYLAAIAGAEEEVAEGQLSLRYGHFAIPYIGTYEMDQTFEAMEPHLGFFDS